MPLEQATYEQVRDRMLPGDTIAFSGTSKFSALIKYVTRSAVSHNGTVIAAGHMIESNAPTGVSMAPMAARISAYDGEVWWLPLSPLADMVWLLLMHQALWTVMGPVPRVLRVGTASVTCRTSLQPHWAVKWSRRPWRDENASVSACAIRASFGTAPTPSRAMCWCR